MKHIALILIVAAFAFGQKAKAVAIVKKAKGLVYITHDGKEVKVKRGTKIYNDDQIVTKEKALVAFVFLDDKSLVRVKENSVFKVKGQREKNSIAKNIVLEIGDVFASVTKQKGEFRIESPTSVASVKGTKFSVDFDSNGLTKTYVYDGLVEVASKAGGGTTQVGKGQKVVTQKDGSQEKTTMSESEQKNIDEDTDDDDLMEFILEFENDAGEKKTLKISPEVD